VLHRWLGTKSHMLRFCKRFDDYDRDVSSMRRALQALASDEDWVSFMFPTFSKFSRDIAEVVSVPRRYRERNRADRGSLR
jgi:hypothetical protein